MSDCSEYNCMIRDNPLNKLKQQRTSWLSRGVFPNVFSWLRQANFVAKKLNPSVRIFSHFYCGSKLQFFPEPLVSSGIENYFWRYSSLNIEFWKIFIYSRFSHDDLCLQIEVFRLWTNSNGRLTNGYLASLYYGSWRIAGPILYSSM